MNRAIYTLVLIIISLFLSFLHLSVFFHGDQSEFPSYIWLLSLPVMPIIGYFTSGFFYNWHIGQDSGFNQIAGILCGAMITAIISEFFVFLVMEIAIGFMQG